jgi:hypothetical protein
MSSIHLPRPSHTSRLRSERGASLIFALLGLVTLTILGMGLTSLGMTATTMANNERDTQEALALADAGMAHAKKLLLFQEWPWDDMTPFLTNGNATACDGDELSQAPPAAPAGYPTLFITAATAGGQAIGTGNYRVYVCDDHLTDVDSDTGVLDNNANADVNKRILVRSVGTTAKGATATVEQVFSSGTAPALLVNGNLSVRGDVEVGGAAGIIHSNGRMDIVGNSVCAEQYFSSTESITGGIPAGGEGCDDDGELRPGSAPVNIRVLSPADFKSRAQYWLTTEVTGGGGGGGGGGPADVVAKVYVNTRYDPTDTTPEELWQVAPTPATWSFSRNSFTWATNGGAGLPETVYYIDTNVNLGGNIQGTGVGGAAKMTILADGWVNVAGSAKLEAVLGAPGNAAIERIGAVTIVTGRDLELSGNTGGGGGENAFYGLFYARHQVNISGSPMIRGQVVALNEADTAWPTVAPIHQVNPSNLVVLDGGFMKITGTPNIEYNGNGLQGLTGRFWRECRFNPANLNPTNPEDACGPLWGGT